MKKHQQNQFYSSLISLILHTTVMMLFMLFIYEIGISISRNYFGFDGYMINRGIALAGSLTIIKCIYFLANRKLTMVGIKLIADPIKVTALILILYLSVGYTFFVFIVGIISKDVLLFFSNILLTGPVAEMDLLIVILMTAVVFGEVFFRHIGLKREQ